MLKTYKVLKPFEHAHVVQPIDSTLELHPRAATFLLTGGFIEELKPAGSEADDATSKPTTRTKK
ncbi:hypothetical protein KDW36_15785 [Burkholderia dolosa]|uniref:hypothetical protein n=1 Tax=Burkholderia dolosa TaxID=152500 RepID=UPI001B986543|nr:hypothetical protein [Burkholderia dolosa]MBR8314645.1 hypothetical protein [Burkholderia dolosa]